MKSLIIVLAALVSLGTVAFAAPAPSSVAYVLVNGSPLYQDNPDKTLKYLEGLTLGDAVTLLNRTAAFKESGKDRDFTRVKAVSGKEGWVRSQYIAAQATLAVVKSDDALVFSEPRDTKVTARSISSMTLVAVLQDGTTDEFARVQGYDVPRGVLFTDDTWLFPSDLSTSETSIQSSILYAVAMASKDAGVRKNLLTIAQTRYPDSIFADRIEAALTGKKPETAAGTGISVVASSTLTPEASTTYRYNAELMFDGNPLTAWAEGGAGSGEGETVVVSFSDPVRFDEIEVMPGFFDQRWYKSNARVKELQIDLYGASDDQVGGGTASFTDTMTPQRVRMGAEGIEKVVITIVSVYAPEQKDLAISEISFWNSGAKIPIRTE